MITDMLESRHAPRANRARRHARAACHAHAHAVARAGAEVHAPSVRRVELEQGRDQGRWLLLERHRELGVDVDELVSPSSVWTARDLVLVRLQHPSSSSRVSCARTWDRSVERERVAATAAERRGLARGHGVAMGERCARCNALERAYLLRRHAAVKLYAMALRVPRPQYKSCERAPQDSKARRSQSSVRARVLAPEW